MKSSKQSRREFLRKATATGILTGAVIHSQARPLTLSPAHHPWTNRSFGANDQVNIAAIGMGIMGFNNMEHTLKVPGVKLVGACDLYSGRLERAKEVYGKDLFTTKNYRELLDRKDIDAVVISTSDHWHDHIAIAAMNKGKHVYVEKPMVHRLEEGAAVIDAQLKTKKVLQVGSQRVSSIVTLKAKELFEQNLIGELIMIETWNDRQSANGAWQYSIPTDAKNNTVDWETFVGDAPKIAYDPVRFFRWRNYQDYGTGVAGDLFVHLFSALHTITSSAGPVRCYSTGGLRYWKDGRDVPDIIAGLYDYAATAQHPAFNLQMRVNFVDGNGGGEMLRLVGSEGVIEVGWGHVKVTRNKISKNPGYGGWDSFDTFSSIQQKDYEKWYKSTWPEEKEQPQEVIEWKAPADYNTNVDHHLAWYAGIREGKAIKEDALFGMRAAGPALLANKSYFEKRIIDWDPIKAVVRN
ncbi:MAG: Gfo/Idh/MocA family protein [Bacteroidota bacterium]